MSSLGVRRPATGNETASATSNATSVSERLSGVMLSESGVNVSLSPSMLSINSNHSSGTSSAADSGGSLVEQEDIIALTGHVTAFRESLSKLRRVFDATASSSSCGEKRETVRVQAHERLGDVLRILRVILEKYATVQSTQLLMAAGTLIQRVKGFNYEDSKTDTSHFYDAIDQLALTFSNRVSEYLMGDIDGKKSSDENLLESADECGLSSSECDSRFSRLPEGVDLALHRAKIWSKYAKDVINYIEKRTHLEAEHSRNMIKLVQTMKPILKEESFLPFQSIYCMALDQDLENSNACLANCALVLGHKFVEPLVARRAEHEKQRKTMKQEWQRELKKMHEAVNNLRKARSMYNQRQQEYSRAKSVLKTAEVANDGVTDQNKIEKKRKSEDEAAGKAIEAESHYRQAIQEANDRCANLEKVKKRLLTRIRELIYQCDQTMKAVTVGYFQLQHTITASSPVQFQTLCESSRLYEPGSQYVEFVKRIPQSEPVKSSPVFSFEPYVESENEPPIRQRSVSDEESVGSAEEADQRTSGKSELMMQSVSSGEELETELNNSKRNRTHRSDWHMAVPSNPDLQLADSGYGSTKKWPAFTKAAQTHYFRKLKTPSRCRECDAYVCFQGTECSQCGLTVHKKCLQSLSIQCGHKRLPRKMTTFGVDLQSQGDDVPYIVVKCISEIERRGSSVKGLYRVSGVKSRVEKLCQTFENGADLVDLSDVHPNVIANLLKLYLRQLPEPLMTFRLYPDFIRVAKEYPSSPRHEETTSKLDERRIVEELRQVVAKLPKAHCKTLAFLIKHLRRVSENAENNMPASNLGIVFGPTLLRTSEGGASLSSLVDTVHQTRVIELLILFSQQVFDQRSPDAELSRETSQLLRGGKHIDFSSMKETTSGHGFASQTVITLSGQKVITSSTATTSTTKPSLYELRRQFFTAPCSPPQLRSLPATLPIVTSSENATSNSFSTPETTTATSQHPKLKRTSSSQTPAVADVVGQELRSSSSSQNFRLIDEDDGREAKFV